VPNRAVRSTAGCRRFETLALVPVLLLSALVGSAAAQTAITSCGQEVSGSAFLMGDLSCPGLIGTPGFGNSAVVLTKRGTLDLRGFTISDSEGGVFCTQGCTVINGTIRDTRSAGVVGENLTLRGVTLSNAGYDNGDGIVTIYSYHATLTDSTVSGSGRFGVFTNRVKMLRSHVTGCGIFGVTAAKNLRLVDSSATGSGTASACGPTRPCGDLASPQRAPRLKNSTCERSVRDVGQSWGVCSLD